MRKQSTHVSKKSKFSRNAIVDQDSTMEDHHVAGGDLELMKGQYYKTEKKMNHYNSKIKHEYDSN